ncbi:MAG: Gfo/Idh/MocA family oxidoreductase [Bacteriovoracaceae bacterium]|jgi:hypothetical protein|nr:Gfo/Idh/MocA family oxidoreductase [Bacteriovoracaceae bacterium]
MKKILITGAGQIGSRHLQALAKSSFDVELFVYDQSVQSLEMSRNRFNEMPTNKSVKKIHFLNELISLPAKVDLLILSTPASVRLQAFKEIVLQTEVINVLFEKVLFQSTSEIEEAGQILKVKNINAWVNCPKRLYEVNERILSFTGESSIIEYSVEGGNWGIGCNAIHFIDHMTCLTGDNEYQISTEDLDPKIWKSKRKGFVDFTGKLMINFSKGHTLKLIATSEEIPRYELKIKVNDKIFEMDEFTNELRVKDIDEKLLERVKYQYPHQSDLTQHVANEILFKNECKLPDFKESSLLHVQLLDPLMSFYKRLGGELEKLPIT